MVLAGQIVGIKRLKLQEVDAMSRDVRSMMREEENGSSAFKIMAPEELGEGVLHVNGKWKESSGKIMGGIHSLVVNGVQTDVEVIAASIKTEQVLKPASTHFLSCTHSTPHRSTQYLLNRHCRAQGGSPHSQDQGLSV